MGNQPYSRTDSQKGQIAGTGVGVSVFYSLCVLVAVGFALVDSEPSRTTYGFFTGNIDKTYLESLKCDGLFLIAALILVELAVLAIRKMKGTYDLGDIAASACIYLINVFVAPLTGL